MKKLALFILLLPLQLFAQEGQVRGVIQDSTGMALGLANVVAYHQSDSSIASFATSDSEGNFFLKLEIAKNYFVRCSYIGYEDFVEEFYLESSEMQLDILMKASAVGLDALNVVYEFPVTISGDTLSYKADAFTNGHERKLGDVLEKLPGLEVDKDGQVKFQGKTVDKVLVEGREFFDGDSKMAVENIPANVVDRIDLINNYTEVGPMKGLGNDDNIALNVQLKEGQKNIWFGDVEAGVGVEERYLAHPNIFYYSPKTSVNFIGDANNIGKQSFSMEDYFRFNGGFRSIAGRGGSNLNLSADELGLALMQNDRAYYSASHLAALNLSHQPNKKWNLSAYGILSGINNQLRSESTRSYVGVENREQTASVLDQNMTSGLLKLEASYTPSASTHLGYQAFTKLSDISNQDQRISAIVSNVDTLLENRIRRPFSIEQNLEAYHALNEKNIITGELNWLYKQQDASYFLQTRNEPYGAALPLDPMSLYRLSQDRIINTNKIESVLNYYFLINDRNHLQFSAGLNTLLQDYRSGIEQIGDEEERNAVDPSIYSNDARYDFFDSYVSMRYRTKWGKLTFNPGINLHFYNGVDKQGEETSIEKVMWLPDLFASYAFSSAKTLRLSYGLNAEFTDIQNRAEGVILRNYNSLFRGNRWLENLYYHNVNLSFMNFNMYNFSTLAVMLNYQKRYDDINESVLYGDLSRISIPTNAVLANENVMASLDYQKKFPLLKINAAGDWSYSDYQNSVELEQNRNISFTQRYSFSLESNFVNWPNIEIGYQTTISDYQSLQLDQRYVSQDPFVNIEAYIPGGFTLIAEYIYTNYRSNGGAGNSEYAFLNGALYYRNGDSPWEFKLAGNNLLNTELIRRDAFSDNIINGFTYYVQPRTVMLSVLYEL